MELILGPLVGIYLTTVVASVILLAVLTLRFVAQGVRPQVKTVGLAVAIALIPGINTVFLAWVLIWLVAHGGRRWLG